MYKIILVTISLFLLSCNLKRSDKNESTGDEKNVSQVENCMKKSLPEYFKNLTLITEILTNDGWIDDYKDSYEILYKALYLFDEVDSFEISDEDRMTLNFMDNMGPHSAICQCSKNAYQDTFLTKNQVGFYQEFAESGANGVIDTDKLSAFVNAMSDTEFESYGIKEATIIFCGQRIIREQYFRYYHPKTEE